MSKEKDLEKENGKNSVPWYAYLVLFLTILFLSGLLTDAQGPLKALDFSNVAGNFGVMGTVEEGGSGEGIRFAKDFKGIGGAGVREGFMLALTAGPTIVLAFGVIQIYNDYKGLMAADKLFSPILRPLLGIPGAAALGIISSFTSADAAAGVAGDLYNREILTTNQLAIMISFMFSAPAILVNFFLFTAALTPYINRNITIALGVIIIMKFFGAIVCRLLLNFLENKEEVK